MANSSACHPQCSMPRFWALASHVSTVLIRAVPVFSLLTWMETTLSQTNARGFENVGMSISPCRWENDF